MSAKTKGTIAVFSGSQRAGRTRHAVKHVEALLVEAGFATEFLCARELDLPVFDTGTADDLPNAKRLRDAVQRAVGVVIGSPEYHGCFSGALKNMLDYLGTEQLEGKPAALIVACGQQRAGIGTLTALRTVLRAVHSPVIVEQVAIWAGDFDEETMELVNEATREQVQRVVDGLAREVALRAPRGRVAAAEPTPYTAPSMYAAAEA